MLKLVSVQYKHSKKNNLVDKNRFYLKYYSPIKNIRLKLNWTGILLHLRIPPFTILSANPIKISAILWEAYLCLKTISKHGRFRAQVVGFETHKSSPCVTIPAHPLTLPPQPYPIPNTVQRFPNTML